MVNQSLTKMKSNDMTKIAAGTAKVSETFAAVQQVIADVTGNEPEDITQYADLEEDLGIDMLTEFPAILMKLQKNYDITLPMHLAKECVTVDELVELVDDEREL